MLIDIVLYGLSLLAVCVFVAVALGLLLMPVYLWVMLRDAAELADARALGLPPPCGVDRCRSGRRRRG